MIKAFEDLVSNRHDNAIKWKNMGKSVFGYFCTYVPEEIIHAAGIIPVRMMGGSDDITLADVHLPSYVCSFARSCYDQGLKGVYSYLDGVIFPCTCDTIIALYSIWKADIKTPYVGFVDPLCAKTETAKKYFREEVARFKESLESFLGGEISDTSLQKSIEIYNANRRLLKEVYELRRSSHPPISGVEALDIVKSSMLTPKEEHSRLLENLLNKISERDDPPESGVRILVSGSVIYDPEILRMIENSGGLIVTDDLCTGTRYFWDLVNTNLPPLTGIADRYYERIPCPCNYSPERRLEHILSLIRDYNVEAVVFTLQKFCDPHLFDYPFIGESLKEAEISTLLLETEHVSSPLGPLKTRIEAFLETIQ
nr:2-hydroxyacyl-CoA dehydratase family protein [Candidatus Freyarchaeota archaeon]